MYAVEFETRLEQGVIPIPPAWLGRVTYFY
jgi:hypothetical protein